MAALDSQSPRWVHTQNFSLGGGKLTLRLYMFAFKNNVVFIIVT